MHGHRLLIEELHNAELVELASPSRCPQKLHGQPLGLADERLAATAREQDRVLFLSHGADHRVELAGLRQPQRIEARPLPLEDQLDLPFPR
jgi:hypothetical protein